MVSISVTRTIHAPIERVWALFTDIAGAPNHLHGIHSVEVLSDQPFGPGFRWRETRRMFGQTATEEMWVTKADEPASYEVEAQSRGTHYCSRYTFTEVAEGTRVDLTFAGTPLGTVPKIMDRVLSMLPTSPVAKALTDDLADLAAVCERM